MPPHFQCDIKVCKVRQNAVHYANESKEEGKVLLKGGVFVGVIHDAKNCDESKQVKDDFILIHVGRHNDGAKEARRYLKHGKQVKDIYK